MKESKRSTGLVNSHQFLKQAVDENFLYALYDENRQLQEINLKYGNLTGYERKELLTLPFTLLLEDSTTNIAKLEEVWKNVMLGNQQTLDYQIRSKNGATLQLRSSFFPLKDEHGEIIRVVELGKEVTASNSLSWPDHLQQNIDLAFGFAVYDELGNIQKANNNYAVLLGFRKEQLIGKHYTDFLAPKGQRSNYEANFWNELVSGKAQKGSLRRITKMGSEVWVQAAFTPIFKNNKLKSVIEISADITGDKREAAQSRHQLKDLFLVKLKEISTAMSEIVAGAKNRDELLTQSDANLKKSLSSAQEIVEQIDAISTAARQGKKDSLSGNTIVKQMLDTMSVLAASSKETIGQTSALASGIQEVSNILTFINEIVNETKLLAFNAKVQAAHAGDSGTGFSVIAEEIKNLAENTKSSTGEIAGKIQIIFDRSTEVSESMERIAQKIKQSEKSVQNVEELFDRIGTSVGGTSSATDTILQDIKRQSDLLKLINTYFEEISAISKQTTIGSEEISSSTRSLEKVIATF